MQLRLVLPGLWLLAMIGLPIARWTWGDSALPAALSVSVALQAASVTAILAKAWGVGRTLRTLGLVLIAGWTVEYIGAGTGFPFGSYAYTDALQPQLGGVPLLIPLAWWMMLPPAWAVAQRIVGERAGWFPLAAALTFTAWDVFLDPLMAAWAFWRWEPASPHFLGIPLTNYLGWVGSALLITRMVRPAAIPVPASTLLFAIYGITWALLAMGMAFFWGLPLAALAGALSMGVCIFAAVRPTTSR